jgi:colanic acid biosynthesis glycosyl transferase WcaI
MRVLFLTMHYYPDGGPSASLFTMLSERLAQRGHQVTVVAAVPHYPTGRVMSLYRRNVLKHTRENGVDVYRIGLPSLDRGNMVWRFMQYIIYQLGATICTLRLNPEIVIAVTPAMACWLPYAYLVLLRRKAAIYSIHDVYPDVGIKLGVFRNSAVIKTVRWLEESFLKSARMVRILSESFVSSMKGFGIPESRLRLIYDWVDTDLIHPLPKENSFSLEQKIEGRFVVLYAGNLGPTHGLDSIVDAARLLKDQKSIQFVFVGEGGGKQRAQDRAQGYGLDSVLFLPYQPRNRLPDILASADVSLVTLQKGFGKDSLPSKTYSILASGRPVIASVDPDTDTWNLVARSQSGLCVPPEDPRALAEAILKLANDPDLRRKFGELGRAYALAHHSPDAATGAFEELFRDAIGYSRP